MTTEDKKYIQALIDHDDAIIFEGRVIHGRVCSLSTAVIDGIRARTRTQIENIKLKYKYGDTIG